MQLATGHTASSISIIQFSGVTDLDPIRSPAAKFAKSLGLARLQDLR